MNFPSWSELECAAAAGGMTALSLDRLKPFYRRADDDPEHRTLLTAAAEEFFTADSHAAVNRIANVFPRIGERDAFHLLAVLACFGNAEENWRRRGFPPELFNAAWRDVGLWVKHHEDNLGSTGFTSRTTDWLRRHLVARIVRLGRLEFEFDLGFDFGISVVRDRDGVLAVVRPTDTPPDAETVLAPGAPVVSIHIPADGPLRRDECLESLRRFGAFAAEYLPSHPPLALVCESWVLDPQLDKLLPGNSNIVRFRHLAGHVFPLPMPADTVWRVFGLAGLRDGVAAGRGYNSMQRRFAEFLRDGGAFQMGFLYIPADEISALL